MSKPFVLAHLSDPHLGPLPPPGVRELASKRLFGYINWRRSRRRLHRRDAHVAITRDLVNIALPAEFAHARHWLETLGRPADVSVVPGNHDAYVAAAGLHRDQQWSPYMAGDVPIDDSNSVGTFPYLRRRGPVALIGVSTAIATPPFIATGKLGEQQIACIAKML